MQASLMLMFELAALHRPHFLTLADVYTSLCGGACVFSSSAGT